MGVLFSPALQLLRVLSEDRSSAVSVPPGDLIHRWRGEGPTSSRSLCLPLTLMHFWLVVART